MGWEFPTQFLLSYMLIVPDENITLNAVGSSSTSKRGTQTWKVTGSSNVYLLNNVSGSITNGKIYWTITAQSTTYTWYIYGTLQNKYGLTIGASLINTSSINSTTIHTGEYAITYKSNTTTYTWTMPLNKKYMLSRIKESQDLMIYLDPLTIYRTQSNYGWG